jgi:hypothetical protein
MVRRTSTRRLTKVSQCLGPQPVVDRHVRQGSAVHCARADTRCAARGAHVCPRSNRRRAVRGRLRGARSVWRRSAASADGDPPDAAGSGDCLRARLRTRDGELRVVRGAARYCETSGASIHRARSRLSGHGERPTARARARPDIYNLKWRPYRPPPASFREARLVRSGGGRVQLRRPRRRAAGAELATAVGEVRSLGLDVDTNSERTDARCGSPRQARPRRRRAHRAVTRLGLNRPSGLSGGPPFVSRSRCGPSSAFAASIAVRRSTLSRLARARRHDRYGRAYDGGCVERMV